MGDHQRQEQKQRSRKRHAEGRNTNEPLVLFNCGIHTQSCPSLSHEEDETNGWMLERSIQRNDIKKNTKAPQTQYTKIQFALFWRLETLILDIYPCYRLIYQLL